MVRFLNLILWLVFASIAMEAGNFSPQMLYYLKTDNGYLSSSDWDGGPWLSAATSSGDAGKFIILGDDDQYLLYNTDVKKYLSAEPYYGVSGTTGRAYVNLPNGTFSIVPATQVGGKSGCYIIKSNVSGNWMIFNSFGGTFSNASTSKTPGSGNQWSITEAGVNTFGSPLVDGTSFSVGNINYMVLNAVQKTVCTIESPDVRGQLEFGASVFYDGEEYSLISIGSDSFGANQNITGVSFVNATNLINIDDRAFAACTNLAKVEFGKDSRLESIGWDSFIDCWALKEFIVPNTVTSIGNGAFAFCKGINKLVYGKNVKNIGDDIFTGLSALKTVISLNPQPPTVGTWGTTNSSATLYVPKASISSYKSASVWRNFSSILAVEDNSDFDDTENPTISETPLEGERKLINGLYYKLYPSSKTALVTYEYLETLDNYASLESVVVPKNVTFGNVIYTVVGTGDHAFNRAPMTSLSLPNSFKTIGLESLAVLQNLKSIEIPDGVTLIEDNAFMRANLEEIIIPNTVTKLSYGACAEMSKLTKITLGSGLQTIGGEAFNYTYNLKELVCLAQKPPTCESGRSRTFTTQVLQNCYLYVPKGSKALYRATSPWSDFKNIEEFSEDISVERIELSNSQLQMIKGENAQLTATVYPEDATNSNISWTSLNEEVATVSADGIVTAVNRGETDIIATAEDGSEVTATCHIIVTLPAASDNYTFSIPDTEISKRKTTLVPVMMNNEKGITSFQCDIHLPAGLSIARNDYDLYDITLSDRADNTFCASASDFNGAVRVLVYSNQNRTIKGNEGTIFYLPIEVTDDKAVNKTIYDLLIDGIYVTLLENFEEKAVDDIHGKLTLVSYNIGDVNNDGRISAADVSLTVSYALGGNPSNGIREAADANGDNRISAADVSIIVSYVLSGRQVNVPQRIVASNSESADAEQTSVEIDTNGNLVVKATGLNMYTSAQFDLTLPAGVNVKAANLSDANTESHALAYRDNGNGTVRFIAYSGNNSNFRGDDVLAVIELAGERNADGMIKVDNAYLAEVRGNEIAEVSTTASFAEIGTSAINNAVNNGITITAVDGGLLINADSDSVITIADMAGRVRLYNVYAGVTRINLEAGVYVVNNNKIIIK